MHKFKLKTAYLAPVFALEYKIWQLQWGFRQALAFSTANSQSDISKTPFQPVLLRMPAKGQKVALYRNSLGL